MCVCAADVIMTSLRYFGIFQHLLNVWNNTQQHVIDTSVDHTRGRVKSRVYAESRHFEQKLLIHLRTDK